MGPQATGDPLPVTSFFISTISPCPGGFFPLQVQSPERFILGMYQNEQQDFFSLTESIFSLE